MKTFNDIAAQGDVTFVRINQLPDGLVPVEAADGSYIVAHSETGHHHVVPEQDTQCFMAPDNNDRQGPPLLYLVCENGLRVDHMRSNDTHESLISDKGMFVVVPQRESDGTLEGWRRALD